MTKLDLSQPFFLACLFIISLHINIFTATCFSLRFMESHMTTSQTIEDRHNDPDVMASSDSLAVLPKPLGEEVNSRKDTSNIYNTESSRMGISNSRVLQQAPIPTQLILIVAIVVVVLLAIVACVIIKRRNKAKDADKTQRKVEKQKFIPKGQLSMEAPFGAQKHGVVNIPGKRRNPSSNKSATGPKVFSPNFKAPMPLKLEDNHQSSVIHDNIFTNLENSPRSQEEESSRHSARQTPKELGFNIEFSVLEHDNSKMNDASEVKEE